MKNHAADGRWQRLVDRGDQLTGTTLGLIGAPGFFQADGTPPRSWTFFAALATSALISIAIQVARTRANLRMRTAWDRYAELELARATIAVQPVRQQVRGR
jgi:hypothetical protein